MPAREAIIELGVEMMALRLKPEYYLQVIQLDWIKHGRWYKGYWDKAMKSPRDVVILHPERSDVKACLPSSMFELMNV